MLMPTSAGQACAVRVPSPVTTLREGDVFVELSLGKFPIRNYPGSLGATVLGTTTGRSIHKR